MGLKVLFFVGRMVQASCLRRLMWRACTEKGRVMV